MYIHIDKMRGRSVALNRTSLILANALKLNHVIMQCYYSHWAFNVAFINFFHKFLIVLTFKIKLFLNVESPSESCVMHSNKICYFCRVLMRNI